MAIPINPATSATKADTAMFVKIVVTPFQEFTVNYEL